MYPTIVIVLVVTQRSMVDICDIRPSNPVKEVNISETRAATEGHLSFAVAQHESVSDSVSDHPQWQGGLKGPEGLDWKAA